MEQKREKVPRVRMPEQTVSNRIRNFNEVPVGLTEEMAVQEAARCLQCKNPQCVEGCPVEVDIPAFQGLVKQSRLAKAARKIKEKNALPAGCGRVCPQEDQCEKRCILGVRGESCAVGYLERFVADWEAGHVQAEKPVVAPPTGFRVAVVGSGPSGLPVAADLAVLGHEVTLFEALHETGGVLVYGIPEFRLPKAIVGREVDYVRSLGVKYYTFFFVGQTFTVDELLANGFQAVYLALGAGLPMFMQLQGENLNGIYSANEFLTRVNLMRAWEFPSADTPVYVGKNVAVIGGGNVAMDCARTALRLGAKRVTVVYRRSRAEMPARHEEIIRAEEEGIIFYYLTNPIRYLADDKHWVRAMECLRMELTQPDASGRRSVVPIEGSEQTIDFDSVIVAIGTRANPIVALTTPDLKVNKWGYYIVDEATGQTSKPGVFAGGDIVTGSATVISAMGAGRKAARAIHRLLTGEGNPGEAPSQP